MSEFAAALRLDSASTGRQQVLTGLPSSWDDVPSGPVPAHVIRYFEDALAREDARRTARLRRDTE